MKKFSNCLGLLQYQMLILPNYDSFCHFPVVISPYKAWSPFNASLSWIVRIPCPYLKFEDFDWGTLQSIMFRKWKSCWVDDVDDGASGDDALLKWYPQLSPHFAPLHTTSAKCAGGSEHIVRGAGRLCSGLVAVPLYNKSDDQIGLAHTPFIPRSATSPPSMSSSSSLSVTEGNTFHKECLVLYFRSHLLICLIKDLCGGGSPFYKTFSKKIFSSS